MVRHLGCVVVLLAILTCQLCPVSRAVSVVSPSKTSDKLFVLLLDGLRWDYVSESSPSKFPNFNVVLQNGAAVNPLPPVFPSLCVPNIYSMFSGLYPSHHGLTGNSMFDPATSRTTDLRYDSDTLDTESALWNTMYNLQGRHSLLYYLPGCSSSNTSVNNHCAKPFRPTVPLSEVLESAKEGANRLTYQDIDLVVVYNDLLDWVGHQYGPHSFLTRDVMVGQIDSLLGVIMQHLSSDHHLAVIGDHGMTEISPARLLTIRQFVRRHDVLTLTHSGGFVGLWPQEGRHNDLLSYFSIMDHPRLAVFTADQLVRQWYVRSDSDDGNSSQLHRLPPISLLSDAGYFLETFLDSYPMLEAGEARGWHGFSPHDSSSHTAFYLMGPRVKSGVIINGSQQGFATLDVYHVLSDLLQHPYQPNRHAKRFLVDHLLNPQSPAIDNQEHVSLFTKTSSNQFHNNQWSTIVFFVVVHFSMQIWDFQFTN